MAFRKILGKVALAVAFLTGVPAITGLTGVLVATQAEAATLASIQVRGNVRIDSATIRSYVPVRIGAEYGQSTLNDTLVALFVTGLFANVEVTGLSGTISIVVVENAVVAQVGFTGNRRVNTNDLTEVVQTASRGVLSNAILEADKRRILQRYEQAGRTATVVAEVQQLGGNVVNVLFRVTEGERQRIASIDFVGNQAFNDRQLAAVIDLRPSGLLSWLSKNDIYSPDTTARDSELLRRHYLSAGYADFQVLSTNVATDSNGSYVITINVSEGPLYRFGQVRVDSTIPGIDQNSFRRDIHIAAGRVFSATDLEQTLEDMAVTLANAGHPFARVVPRANRDYATSTIELTLLVDEGARIYIERIDIAGNERTRDYVIRREFDFAEGDAYNRVLVDRVERRLRSLGLFDQVSIIEQQGSAPDQVILMVQVDERRTGQVSLTAGYSTADGILGEISLTEENFLGRGQYLRLAFSIGPNNRSYSVSFTEPYFLGRRLPIGFDVYHRTAQASDRPFDEATTGAQIRLGLPLTEALALQLSYRFVNQVITNAPPGDPFFTNGTITTSSVTYGFTFSTVDNLRDPTRGLYVRASQELAGLGGNNNFLRSTVDARLYQPLGYNSPIIAAFRVQAGDIRGRMGDEVRPTDLFVLGGDNIRGFANAGFGPREMGGAETGIGGMQYWTVNAELRFPFPFLPPDAGFRAAVFADAGMLTGVPASFAGLVNDGGELRASVGASVMWASPIGLLRLDFARVLRSATYDITQAIRFSIGGEF